jgi:phenylalanyl-tRNA synthetase beta chain
MNNGIKPINNILDTLNIVTLLTNVPTAVYDADLVKNIDVQYAKKGEKFTGFNEKQYILSDSDIVIRNEKKDIICLAGILGDNKYGLTNGTKNILIEVANFDFVSIRETAKKFDIQTDAASRMSKKIPNYTTLLAASLIQEVFAKYGIGKYVGNKTKCEEEKIKPISINEKYISSILGTSVSKKEIASYLQ